MVQVGKDKTNTWVIICHVFSILLFQYSISSAHCRCCTVFISVTVQSHLRYKQGTHVIFCRFFLFGFWQTQSDTVLSLVHFTLYKHNSLNALWVLYLAIHKHTHSYTSSMSAPRSQVWFYLLFFVFYDGFCEWRICFLSAELCGAEQTAPWGWCSISSHKQYRWHRQPPGYQLVSKSLHTAHNVLLLVCDSKGAYIVKYNKHKVSAPTNSISLSHSLFLNVIDGFISSNLKTEIPFWSTLYFSVLT